MRLASKAYDVPDVWAAQEFYHANGWTDGLPIVPPTREAVAACLEMAVADPVQLVGVEPVRGVAVTAEKLAINAVMAGCLPTHFPVVLACFAALLRPEFLLHGATASTGGCAVLVVLNGPVRRELDASGGFNALGNSGRATAVIGRAIRLALINILEVRPGGIDRSTLGHPGQVLLLRRRGRRGHGLAAALGPARIAGGHVGGDRYGGGRAAPAVERMDDGARGNPRNLRRRNAREHAALFDLAR
jgi:hypothetical protein